MDRRKAPAQHDEPNPREPLAEIFGDSELDAQRRIELLKVLTLPLGSEEWDRISDFLTSAVPPPGMSVRNWRWFMDELFTVLRHDGKEPDRLASQLETLYRNSDADPIVRDYAVQHLGHLLSEGSDPGSIVPVLFEATSQTQNTIAGSALLALNQSFPKNAQISAKALELASDPTTHLSSRLTALQVAAGQESPAALALAQGLASDTSQASSLRVSAIATVARLGSPQDQALLQNLATSRDPRIQIASSSALEKLAQQNR